MYWRILFLPVVVQCLLFCSCVNGAKIFVKKMGPCNPAANYAVKVTIDLKNRNKAQYVSGNITLPVPMDDNMGGIALVDYVFGSRSLPVVNLKEKNVCDAFNRYLGEIWYDAARSAGITPKKCPVPKGHYELKNFKLDFDKMAFSAIPFGDLEVRSILVNNRDDKELVCILTQVESQK